MHLRHRAVGWPAGRSAWEGRGTVSGKAFLEDGAFARIHTADGDCSHETKRRLLLGRKVMTNLESILKSTDITLPTKVHLFKAMIFSSIHVWM